MQTTIEQVLDQLRANQLRGHASRRRRPQHRGSQGGHCRDTIEALAERFLEVINRGRADAALDAERDPIPFFTPDKSTLCRSDRALTSLQKMLLDADPTDEKGATA